MPAPAKLISMPEGARPLARTPRHLLRRLLPELDRSSAPTTARKPCEAEAHRTLLVTGGRCCRGAACTHSWPPCRHLSTGRHATADHPAGTVHRQACQALASTLSTLSPCAVLALHHVSTLSAPPELPPRRRAPLAAPDPATREYATWVPVGSNLVGGLWLHQLGTQLGAFGSRCPTCCWP